MKKTAERVMAELPNVKRLCFGEDGHRLQVCMSLTKGAKPSWRWTGTLKGSILEAFYGIRILKMIRLLLWAVGKVMRVFSSREGKELAELAWAHEMDEL